MLLARRQASALNDRVDSIVLRQEDYLHLTLTFLIVSTINTVIFNILNAVGVMEVSGRAKCNTDILLIKSGINFFLFCIQVLFSDSFSDTFYSHRFHVVFVTPTRTSHLTEHNIRSRQKPHSVVVWPLKLPRWVTVSYKKVPFSCCLPHVA